MQRVLPVPHFHAVFTVPSALRPLFRDGDDREQLYNLLLKSAARTLEVLARKKFGATLGMTAVLHTWNQDLLFHPHVHLIVTAGGLRKDGTWAATPDGYLLPVRQMGAFFRGAFLRDLKTLHAAGDLHLGGTVAGGFQRLIRGLYAESWVTYVKRPFAGTEAFFAYLGRYTHRVGISDSRLLEVNAQTVTFSRRDQPPATIPGVEFLRRLLLHVLPTGFRKIRHYGLYAPAAVNNSLARARALFPASPAVVPPPGPPAAAERPPRPCPICAVGVLHTVLLAPMVGRRDVQASPPRDTS